MPKPEAPGMSRRDFLQSSMVLAAGAAPLLVGCSSTMPPDGHPVVETAQGRMRGVTHDGIAAFYGIPYAESPVGPWCFRPPVRVGVGTACTTFGLVSLQREDNPFEKMGFPQGAVLGDDSLNLNVWTPAPGRGRLPVFVWIHDGGFQWARRIRFLAWRPPYARWKVNQGLILQRG